MECGNFAAVERGFATRISAVNKPPPYRRTFGIAMKADRFALSQLVNLG
jgi:hypothetical protein